MAKKEPASKTLLPYMTSNLSDVRERAGKNIMEEVGKLLARITSNESGRIVETVIQLLPDDAFKTLAYLVIGNERDDFPRSLIYEIAFRVAYKMGKEFDSPDPVTEAAEFIAVLINCENLRRKGHMEYLAPDDIFTSSPKFPGFNKLTESGRQLYYKELLEMKSNPKFVM
jgi:hypothetical protein